MPQKGEVSSLRLSPRSAKTVYLCHFAADDLFEPSEAVAEMERALRAAARPVTIYTYPGTTHSFFGGEPP
jgi:carboxymethylenebutenolidase